MNLYKLLLTYSSPTVLLIGVLCGIYYFKFIDRRNRWLLLFLIVCIAFDVIARYMGTSSGNNLILWPLFSLVELLLISAVFLSFIRKSFVLISLLSAGSIYILTEIIYIDVYNVTVFQSYAKIISSFLLVLVIIYMIIWQLKNDINVPEHSLELNTVLLVNYALNLLLLLPINLLINANSGLITIIWIFYLGVTVLYYSYLSYVIWKNGKNRKRLHYGL